MSYTVTCDQSTLEEILLDAVINRHDILVEGAPGGGKTAMATQAVSAAAEKLEHGASIYAITCSSKLPEDLTGYGMPDKDGHPTLQLFGALHDAYTDAAKNPERTVVILLDDVGQTRRQTQPALMTLLGERRAGDLILPHNIVFLGTTNDTTHGSGVNDFYRAFLTRFHSIIHLEPTVSGFLDWATKSGQIHPLVIAWLRQNPDAYLDTDAPEGIQSERNSRTWHKASDILTSSSGLSQRAFECLLVGSLGERGGVDFHTFVTRARGVTRYSQIVLDPQNAPVPQEHDLRYMTLLLACQQLRDSDDKTEEAQLRQYFSRYSAEYQSTFETMIGV